MRITRFAAVLTLALAAAPTLMAATRLSPGTNASSSALATATKLPVNMELRSSLHSGAALNALFAKPFITCWADIGYPNRSGSNVISYNTWQCSSGIEQQISLVASLTAPNGTRYQFTKTCYSTQSCSYNPMSAPYTPGTWTAKADYAYVVYGDGSSGYWWGGQISQLVP